MCICWKEGRKDRESKVTTVVQSTGSQTWLHIGITFKSFKKYLMPPYEPQKFKLTRSRVWPRSGISENSLRILCVAQDENHWSTGSGFSLREKSTLFKVRASSAMCLGADYQSWVLVSSSVKWAVVTPTWRCPWRPRPCMWIEAHRADVLEWWVITGDYWHSCARTLTWKI